MGSMLEWAGPLTARVGDEEFAVWPFLGADPGALPLFKVRAQVEEFAATLARADGGNIVELGIAGGGSSAFAAVVAHPRKLVCIDLVSERVAALDAFVERHTLGGVVRPYYGVDQADRRRIAAILDEEFDGEALDLVIDDASHRGEPTRASFETLFPRLRPGGIYVIEDWSWQHLLVDALMDVAPDPPVASGEALGRWFSSHLARFEEEGVAVPGADEHEEPAARAERALLQQSVTQVFSRLTEPGSRPIGGERRPFVPAGQFEGRPALMTHLALQLMIACALSDGVVSELLVGRFTIAVTRGPRELDPANFRLADHAPDHFGLITE